MSSIPMDLNEILRRIAALESSGGANVNHATITDPNSMHFGDAAVGNFGMMPRTAAQQVRKDDDLADLRGISRDALGQQMKANPALQQRIASELLRDLMQQFPNNPEAVAAAWYSGPEAGHRVVAGNALLPDEERYLSRFRGVGEDARMPSLERPLMGPPTAPQGAPQRMASALPEAPAAPPLPAEPPPQPPAPTRILDDYDSRRLALGGQAPGQSGASALIPLQQAQQPTRAPVPPPPPPQQQALGLPSSSGGSFDDPRAMFGGYEPPPSLPAGTIFDEPPDFLAAVRDALGQAPAGAGGGGSMGGQPEFRSPLRAQLALGQYGPSTSPFGDTPEDVANSVISGDLANRTGGEPVANRYFGDSGAGVGNAQWPTGRSTGAPQLGLPSASGGDFADPRSLFQGYQPPAPQDEMTRRIMQSQPPGASQRPDGAIASDADAEAAASFGRFRAWGQPPAPGPEMPPLSPSEHGRAWATPPPEFSDPRQMFMRPGASPGSLSDSYQPPAPERVKDAEMALAYHMKSYDPVGLLTAEQRQRSLSELTSLMSPQERQGDNLLMGLGRAFAAGGHAAGVEPLSRAFGVMQGERARQDALAAQQDQQRRAQVNDLTQLLSQDRQAQAFDYQINKPQDTLTMPGLGEVPAAMADDIMRAQWQQGAQGRWEAEQAAQQGQWTAQNQLGRDALASQDRNRNSLITSRESAADARVLSGARSYADMVLRMNAMQRKADSTVPLITEEQAWQMALSKMQPQDPNAPLDMDAFARALGSQLVTNEAPEQPSAGGAATKVASGQLVDPKTRLPVPR